MNINEEIIKHIKEFLGFMGIANFTHQIEEPTTSTPLTFKIYLDDTNDLIGGRGGNISNIEHLIKIIIKRKNIDQPLFVLDINDYRKSKEISLKELAKTAAQKVVLSNESHNLPPMSSYERRIIHLELAARPDISTESQGDGEDRYIIIRPNKSLTYIKDS
ncbi:hypothetical protein HY061_01575 [Candidatus Azambacteria bacterium]|nr:hypothetical protein [Candidatus Azambacteria bacterium]